MRVPNEGQAVEDFGQLLRHQLNNPLTGILGNAELLLSEIRRKNGGRMPQGGRMHLETIAALVVRLRETVRRLSQEWEAAQGGSSEVRGISLLLFSDQPTLARLCGTCRVIRPATMKPTPQRIVPASVPFELAESLGQLEGRVPVNELAPRVVRAAMALSGVVGARLWRIE